MASMLLDKNYHNDVCFCEIIHIKYVSFIVIGKKLVNSVISLVDFLNVLYIYKLNILPPSGIKIRTPKPPYDLTKLKIDR